jgi:hypothetical protein
MITVPVLRGKVDRDAEQAILALAKEVNRLSAIPAPVMTAGPVYSITQIQQALQATGTNPLNLTGLAFGSGTGAGVVVGTHSGRSSVSPDDGLFYYETDRQTLYVGSQSKWLYVTGQMTGTLDPDTKPTLTADDAGFLFDAADFNRIYRWSGTAWGDAPGSEPRGLVIFSWEPSLIGVGWAVCDGSATTMSSHLGGTLPYFTPDLITDNRFLRSNSVEGGTGGAESIHTPGPTGVTEVQAGAGVTVAADDHTHGGIDILNPYMDMVPYIRL